MESCKNGLFRIISLFTLALMLNSCSAPNLDVRITSENIGSLTGISAEPIPLRSGLYIGAIFKSIPSFSNKQYPSIWMQQEFLANSEVRNMFEQAARKMFADIVPLSGTEGIEDFKARNLDVILVVGQIFLSDNLGAGGGFRYIGDRLCKATVAATWEVTSADGNRVYFTKVIGDGQKRVPLGTIHEIKWWNYRKQALVAALDDYFEKVYIDIIKSGWWKDTSWKSR